MEENRTVNEWLKELSEKLDFVIDQNVNATTHINGSRVPVQNTQQEFLTTLSRAKKFFQWGFDQDDSLAFSKAKQKAVNFSIIVFVLIMILQVLDTLYFKLYSTFSLICLICFIYLMTKYAKIVRFEDTVDAESLVDSKIGDYFLDTYSLPFSSLLMKKRYFYAYLVLFLSTVCNAIALFSMFTQPLSFLGWICFFLDVALMVLIVITYIFVRNFVTNYLRILLIIDGKKISGDILTRKLKIVK